MTRRRFVVIRDPRDPYRWWRVFDTHEMQWMGGSTIYWWRARQTARGFNRIDRRHPNRRADAFLRSAT